MATVRAGTGRRVAARTGGGMQRLMRHVTARVTARVMVAGAVALVALSVPMSGGVAAPAPQLRAAVVNAAAVASPEGSTLAFEVVLSAPASTPVTVLYKTVDGTALAGRDYTAAVGAITIPANTMMGTIHVAVLPQPAGQVGPDRSMYLLSLVEGFDTLGNVATGTIHPSSYLAASSSPFADVVIDPTSTTAYLTEPATNEVAVLDLATGSYEEPIPVGSSPAGLDISPDGRTLYVCDSGAQAISEVDLATRTVTTITTPTEPYFLDTPYSIAVADNDTAVYTTMFAGSGWTTPMSLDLTTGVSTPISGFPDNDQVSMPAPVVRSGDYTTIGVVGSDDSGGPFAIYQPDTGTFVSGSLNGFVQDAAIDGDGGLMAVDNEFTGANGTFLISTATGALAGTVSGPGTAVALNTAGTVGYRLQGTDVGTFDPVRSLPTGSLALPDPVGSGGGALALSPDGHVLVAATADGASILRL